jgi:hypothetical protein
MHFFLPSDNKIKIDKFPEMLNIVVVGKKLIMAR